MDATDHYPILCKIDERKSNNTKSLPNEYCGDKSKFIAESFCENLEKNLESFYLNLSQLTSDNFCENFDKFTSIVPTTIDKHEPLKKLSRRQLKLRSKPWLTKGILISIKNKFYLNKIVDCRLPKCCRL